MRLPLALLAAALSASPTWLHPQSLPKWRYTEELKLGSEADDATGFGDVRGILVDKNQNIWVLEASLQEIRVFTPAGKLLRTVGRKGQGPGEFIYADGMALDPDGLIWVHDPKNGRFSLFDQNGKFVRQQSAPSMGYGFIWSGGIDSRGRIWDRIFVPDPNDPYLAKMRRATPDWSRVDTLSLPKCSTPGVSAGAAAYKFPNGYSGVPYYPQPVAVTDYNSESMWCATSGNEYRFVRVGIATKDTLARLVGKAERVPVSAVERDSAIAPLERRWKSTGGPAPDYSRIPRVKPLLASAFTDGEGRLWVRRTVDPKAAEFDVYSADGSPVATLRVPHPVVNWVRPVVRSGAIWFLAQETGEIPYVIRARFTPAP